MNVTDELLSEYLSQIGYSDTNPENLRKDIEQNEYAIDNLPNKS